VYARFERAEAAHANGLENAPLFIGAVLAGNVAGLESCEFDSVFLCPSLRLPGGGVRRERENANWIVNTATLNASLGAFLGLRVLYTALYVNTTDLSTSRLRSVTWLVSTLVLFGVYIGAGNKMLAA
jgi:uncharacterized MAPEG superfamily protein